MLIADLENIDDLTSAIKEKYEKLEKRIAYLEEENKKLKDNVWKDEEMARMKKQYDEMKEDYYRGFPISKDENEKIQKFIKEHQVGKFGMYKIDAAGTRFWYEFHPTPIGVAGIVHCTDGSEFQFQELG